MGSKSDQSQDIVDLCGQSNGGSRKQFVEQNLDRIEPVERFWMRAVCDSFIIVAFAEVPKPNLVEIVQAEGSCEGVYENDVFASRGGDDIGQIEFIEIS